MIISLVIFAENCHFEIKIAFLLLKFTKKYSQHWKRVVLVPKFDVLSMKLTFLSLNLSFMSWKWHFARFDEWWRNRQKISDPTVTQRDKSQREMMLISYQSYPKMTKNDSKTQSSNQSLDKIEFIFKALKIHSQIEHVSS